MLDVTACGNFWNHTAKAAVSFCLAIQLVRQQPALLVAGIAFRRIEVVAKVLVADRDQFAIGGVRLEAIGAGPDRVLWSADDALLTPARADSTGIAKALQPR